MASELFYYCDPDRNTECKKRICHIREKPWARCELTRNQDFAKTDQNGIPLIYGLKFEGGIKDDESLLR